jgi:hypothetical protein
VAPPISLCGANRNLGGIEMKANKVISCGMLVAMLSGVGFAQRARLANGGTMPGARLPNAVHVNQGTPVNPPSINNNKKTAGATPNATNGRTTNPTPNTRPNADRVVTPDTNDLGTTSRVGPNQ